MEMNQVLSLFALLIFVLLPVSLVFSQDEEANDLLRDLPKFAEKVLADWGVPGMAVGVVKDGKVIYMDSFGYRDMEKQLPVTTNTLFAIGSSTKAFTATAIGMLVDDGKLDLDTPLIEYLPDFRLFDDYATLHTTTRDLLCHRTGLPGYDALWILSAGSRDEFTYRLRYLEPNSDFRDKFQYSNLMYMVAGNLVGRLSDNSWEEFVANRIFKPLNMENSNFSVKSSQRAKDFSQPYMSFTGDAMQVPFRNIDALGPGGSINSNIEDMVQWLLLHLNSGKVDNKQIISEASLAQTHLPNIAIRNPLYEKMGQFSIYGQGWGISNYQGHSLIEHGGNIDGFSALVSLLPEENIGVVVLSNTLNIMGYVIVRDIYDRLLGLEEQDWNSYYKNLLAEIMEDMFGTSGAEEKAIPNTSPSLPLINYAGTYKHPAFERVKIKVDNDKLKATFQSGLTSNLEHYHFDVFKGSTSDFYLPAIVVHFNLNDSGTIVSFSVPLESNVPEIVFKRLESENIN
jgi:CubicO group peptidase (beta-lactamase class C family)